MDASFSPISREFISTTAPCHFIDKSKKLFEEIKEKKDKFENNFDRNVGAIGTAEYYELLDSSVRDRDALDRLRLRRLLQKELKAVGDEVQNDVKKKFAKKQFSEDCDSRLNDLSKANVKDTKSKSHISAKPSSPMVRSRQPHYMLPTRSTAQKAPYQIELPPCKHVVQDTPSFPQMQETEHLNSTYIIEDKNKDPVMLSQKLSERIQTMFKPIQQPRLNGFCVSDRDKYFPCAIPLAPPSRRKINEVVTDDFDEEINNVPSVMELHPAVTTNKVHLIPEKPVSQNKLTDPLIMTSKIGIVQSVPERPVLQNKFTAPVTTSKIGIVQSVSEKPVSQNKFTALPVTTSKIETVQSVLEKPASQNKLTIETLPSINIIGKSKPIVAVNSKLFCFQSEDSGRKSESPEILERQISPDVRSSDAPTPRLRNAEQRFTTAQLSGILNALNRCRTEMNAERLQLDRKQIENLVIEIVEQNMQKDNVSRTRETSTQEEVNKMVNVETQTTKQMNKTVTMATQTDRKPAIDKAQQATCIIPLKSINTQTEVKGDIDKELIIVKLHNHCLSSHQYCNIPYENPSSIPFEVNARTSTPIDSEPEALTFKKSQGTNTMILPKESDVTDAPEGNRSSSIETRDAYTSAIFDRECQTVPETRDATAQYEIPERMVCSSTMTTEVSNREVSVQSEPPEDNVAEISNIHAEIDMKSVAIQSDFLDLSLSSTTTTVSTVTSDNEFVDDLLSEGEIHLPWNLRLLSLIERGIIPRNIPPSLDSSGATSKATDEPSLSEGEIHPKHLALIQNINESQCSQSMTSNSPALLYSSDSSAMEPVPQRSSNRCQFSDSQISSLRSDLSEGQIPNPSILKPDSTLSSGGDNIPISDIKLVPFEKAQPSDMSSEREASASSVNIPHKLPSPPSTSLPETKFSILDNSKFRSFLSTTSELNPSTSLQGIKDLKHPIQFTSPCLEKYLSDMKISQAHGISKSPDLRTVTEEDFNEGKDDTENDKDNQLSSDGSSTRSEDNDESFYSTDSAQHAN